MKRNCLLICPFVILLCFVTVAVGHRAIIGGHLAVVDQFRYQVLVWTDGERTCGGGIIGTQHVITAAHCFLTDHGNFSTRHVSITAGTNDLFGIYPSPLIIEVAKIFVAAEYHEKNLNTTGDIAVLKMRQPLLIQRNRHLQVLNLPSRDYQTYFDETAWIAGFGWDWIHTNQHEEDGGFSDGRLRWAETDVVSNSNCQLGHRDRVIGEKHLCARVRQFVNRRRGVCTGDSGGPLVRYNTVIGILSASPGGCVENRQPAIYTRVSHYVDFIEDAMNDILRDNIRTLVNHH